jgi:hypothetical protein
MQPRYVCTLKMGYWSLSCGWMEIRFNIDSYITVCICYPQVRLMECLPRDLALPFTVCLLANCSSEVNTTAKCWCILLKGTYIVSMFRWKCWTSVCYHTKKVSENQVWVPLTYALCAIFSTHDCPNETESSDIRPKQCSQWQLPFHCNLHLLIRKYSWCIQ